MLVSTLKMLVRYLEANGYVNPLMSVLSTKEEIRNVYRPFADSVKFAKPMAPNTVIHYQVKYSPKIEFGITNQTIFQKKLYFIIHSRLLQSKTGQIFQYSKALIYTRLVVLVLVVVFNIPGKVHRYFLQQII